MNFTSSKSKEPSKKSAEKTDKKKTIPQTDPSRFVILAVKSLKKTLLGCDALLVRIADGRAEMLNWESFPGETGIEDARTWIEKHLAAQTVVMLSGSDVICRTFKLPPASPDQLEMALRLQIENMLLGGSARWRTNAALLPINDPDHDRIGLVVDWPTSSDGPLLPLSFSNQSNIFYAPPIAALVTLVTGAITQGNRESLAVHLERTTGAISIAYSDGIHSAYRTLREDGSDVTEWRASVIRSTSETLMLADIPNESIQSALDALRAVLIDQTDGLLAPLSGSFSSFQTLADSSPADEAWWQQNGVLLGTAIALSGPLARIASLKAKVATENEQILARILSAASKPKIAIRIGIAALLLIAIAPPALSGSRLLYLQWALPNSEAYERTLILWDKQNGMYRDYEKNAWPMGKLLADLASCTPEGIELESIGLTQGAPITVQGNAKPQGSSTAAEAILLMERQLRESRVFDRIEKNWDPPNANGILKFSISASVAKPLFIPKYPDTQDFALRTLRDRRYGPGPIAIGSTASLGSDEQSLPDDVPTSSTQFSTSSSTATAPMDSAQGIKRSIASTRERTQGTPPSDQLDTQTGGSDSTSENASDSRSLQRRSAAVGTAAPDAARRGRGGTGDDPMAMPPPLSDEQISSMTQAEAREALATISKARGTPGIDPDVEVRLKAEFYRLLEQAKKK